MWLSLKTLYSKVLATFTDRHHLHFLTSSRFLFLVVEAKLPNIHVIPMKFFRHKVGCSSVPYVHVSGLEIVKASSN